MQTLINSNDRATTSAKILTGDGGVMIDSIGTIFLEIKNRGFDNESGPGLAVLDR